MTVSSVNGAARTAADISTAKSKGNTLDQADFLKLLTTQMTMQDPTDPVDNKEMIAQMAQFSSRTATTEMSETLKAISTKLDVVLSGKAGEATGNKAAEKPAAETPVETGAETPAENTVLPQE